jgi:hypothetical protein
MIVMTKEIIDLNAVIVVYFVANIANLAVVVV